MRHDRHNRKHNNSGNWKNNGRHDHEGQKNSKPVFKPTIKSVSEEQIRESEEAIRQFKNSTQIVPSVSFRKTIHLSRVKKSHTSARGVLA